MRCARVKPMENPPGYRPGQLLGFVTAGERRERNLLIAPSGLVVLTSSAVPSFVLNVVFVLEW